jgi:hypothetical protein
MHLKPQGEKLYVHRPRIIRVGRSKLREKLNEQISAYKARERVYSAISAGAFFILLGIVYVINLPSNLWDEMVYFFGRFTLAEVPGTGILLPAPISPADHAALYGAVFQFCIGLGILQVINWQDGGNNGKPCLLVWISVSGGDLSQQYHNYIHVVRVLGWNTDYFGLIIYC